MHDNLKNIQLINRAYVANCHGSYMIELNHSRCCWKPVVHSNSLKKKQLDKIKIGIQLCRFGIYVENPTQSVVKVPVVALLCIYTHFNGKYVSE